MDTPPPIPADPVSGALNLPAFGAAYGQALASGRYDQLALWYLDIRNFRSVNPKFGFVRGNVVLQTLVQQLHATLAHELPVARLGADRFIMLTAHMDFDTASARFDETIATIDATLLAQGIGHQMVLSAGIYYLRPEDYHEHSFQRPLDYVSIAHRKARLEATSSLALFTEEDLERDTRRIAIEQSIDEALVTGQIQVWYQPQIDYALGEVIGAEALARWHHPELGWISPMEFIPALEECGKVHDLDLYIWEEACRSAGRWYSVADGTPVPISVNVSRTEMFEPGLMEHFLELQRKYNLPPGSLRLEVTESAFVEEADRLYKVIEKMRSNDMLVEMDDFGSGLSSLNMLKDVPVDVVKLDMGFIRSSVNEDRGGVVLGSVIRMLQGLDTPIIAEGVETLEQAEMLKNMGCHLMQGFHFSKPMPLSEFESFMASNRAVVHTERRERTDSHLDELTEIDAASSYLFNHAMGGTMFCFAGSGTSESILVNDQFYEECGLSRSDFGNKKINPIQEIDPASRATLWRAAAEARERGGATCRAEVRLTGRWIECVVRYLGASSRGDIYSINIVRSGALDDKGDQRVQTAQDLGWDVSMLDKIVPNGFVKCALDTELTIDYISPVLVRNSELSEEEFVRRFHNSLLEAVVAADRDALREAIQDSRETGDTFSCDVALHCGYGDGRKCAHILGRVYVDEQGKKWVYALVMQVGELADGAGEAGARGGRKVVEFDYVLASDLLVIHEPLPDGTTSDITIEGWLDKVDASPDLISEESAAKVIATVRDLRHHPIAGFSDMKCNMRGGDELRWYHVNYVCDADEDGNTTVVHGYAQDANDQMGSVRWWRRQAERDYLTGLLNRNAVEQQINLALHTQGAGMMLMVDLDGFKRVNDELGHLAGDALLREVSEALAQNFREGDVLGRYGGDEFVAFVPLPGDDAQRIASLRASNVISSIMGIEVGDGTYAACSVGVAITHSGKATFYDLLELADEALYASKEAGKGTYTIVEMA